MYGMNDFVHAFVDRAAGNYYERHLGIDTYGYINPVDLGFTNTEFNAYIPIGYRAIYSVLERIPLEKSKSTFVDYGAGKGRAVVVAATLPFKRVIGIELSAALLEAAKNNVGKMRYKRAASVELYQMDATQYVVPKDVNMIFFYNPFKGQALKKVVDNIYDSYQQYPRKIYIIFFNNDHFEKVIANQNWIMRIYKKSFNSINTCGIYVTKAL
jgi:16S rRNA G966 N2-methylase RsmD